MQGRCCRLVGRPAKKPVVRYHDFMYQAASWDQPRRIGAKGKWHRARVRRVVKRRRHSPCQGVSSVSGFLAFQKSRCSPSPTSMEHSSSRS